MKSAPAFWWKAALTPAARLLAPLGALWGAASAWRMALRGERVGVPVICVGNFVAGGAGKTPVALALANRLCLRGETPVFLSRGYGGQSASKPVLVDPVRHGAAEVGDEPLLLARLAPTIVNADRRAGAKAALAAGASVVVMDDGLQNPDLVKDLSFAVVDGQAGIGNGRCIPAGPLRAPLAAQWALVDALVVIGPGQAGELVAQDARRRGKPVLLASMAPDKADAARLRGRNIFAFAGIGRPAKFFGTLAETGARITGTREFPDHHAYSADDFAQLKRLADELDATLVTTEKDAVRLPARAKVETLAAEIVFADEDALASLLDRVLAK